MSESPNPFTPTFGKVPAVLAGRDLLLQEIGDALRNGGGDPNLCSLFSGPRGVGKTVLLAYLASHSRESGWVAANVTSRPGMLEDIIERATDAADELVSSAPSVRITSVNVPVLFGATWEYRDPESGNWRTRMNRLLDRLQERGIGLLITIDEIDPSLDELIDFASTYQHFVRENRRVALFMAGLPASVSALLSDKSASFLRRAAQHQLGRIDDADVRAAFLETVEDAGKTIDEGALAEAVRATDGFAYMMQLVGFRMWAEARGRSRIELEDALRGSARAREDFISGVSLSHACVLRRCWELVGDGRIFQFGIRSGDREEFRWGASHVKTSRFSFEGLEETLRSLAGQPVYFTVDLDVLDPSVFPGTGTPEPGGVSFDELRRAATLVCRSANVVACDVNELSPPYDPSGNSTAAACKIVREMLLALLPEQA